MFEGLARFAAATRKNLSRRRTEAMLNSLPRSVQKDIGWRWSADRPSTTFGTSLGWEHL